jgi:hypothetical protein
MQHHPVFFLTILFFGINISFLPCVNIKYYKITKFCLCSCIFPFYYFAGQGTSDLNTYQSILDSISNSSITSVSEDASQSYEILSLISLWLFRIFDRGAYLWHASIVIFLFISIIVFIESVVGKKPLIPGICFTLVLPALLGEFIINQSRQLLATTILIICLTYTIENISNLKHRITKTYFDMKIELVCVVLIICAGLAHYSSVIISAIILPLIAFPLFLGTKTLSGKIFRIILATLLLIICLYLSYPLLLAMALPSLEFSTSKYLYYKEFDSTFTFMVESLNGRLIQCLFLLDFFRLWRATINQKHNTKTQSLKVRFYLYITGFIIYIFCFWAIYTPGIMDVGRRLLYYALVAQGMSFSISLSMVQKITIFLILTLPFTLYSVIMILQEQNMNSGNPYFVF